MAEDKDAGEPVAIIAKVDATIERYLSGRFKIKGFPSLLMFSKGQMITYQGDRSYDDLLVFVKGGFRKVGGEPVPKGTKEMGALEQAWNMFDVTIKRDMDSIWEFHKAAFFLSLGVTLFIGLMLGYCLFGGKKAVKGKQN
mmetsp:Transcript_22581/g.51185  ORF Transcript_22581/g.51185 Transcript_22581/m.51185 type:complete len:140 (-) Transcript_22581:83-502(-)